MTAPTAPAKVEEGLFLYASHVLPNRPLNIMVVGGDQDECTKAANGNMGAARVSSARFILSLKGYSHGNTKKPDPESLDFIMVDARSHDLAKLEAPFHLVHETLAPRARSAWLLPLAFLTSDEAANVRHSLSQRYSVTHIHRSSDHGEGYVTVWIGNAPPALKQAVVLSQNGPATAPEFVIDLPINIVRNTDDWTALLPGEPGTDKAPSDALSDHFDIRRGVETGADDFFVLAADEIEKRGIEVDAFRPVLPAPTTLEDEVIETRPGGFPDTAERLLMLQTDLSIEEITSIYPKLAEYLSEGAAKGIPSSAAAAKREPWYALEKNAPPPILCAAREGQPCWFILNTSKAVATDQYVAFYPKPHLATAIARNAVLISQIWSLLNKTVDASDSDATLDTVKDLQVEGLGTLISG